MNFQERPSLKGSKSLHFHTELPESRQQHV
jgi:hypothetical protein